MKVNLYSMWHCIRQRPHHLVDALHDDGHEVEIFTAAGYRERSKYPASNQTVHSLALLSSRLYSIPLLGTVARRANRTIEKYVFEQFLKSTADIHIHQRCPSPLTTGISKLSGYLIYDCVDFWEGFNGADRNIREWEHLLCDRANEIWVVSNFLAERLSRWKGKIRIVPNGVDFDHFSSATRAAVHSGISPHVVYVGAIYDWFDVALLRETALLLPEFRFTLVGPSALSSEAMQQLCVDNVTWIGPKNYGELPSILSQAHVAVIPFLINDLIRGTSPIKLYEYLAAGIPVVASPMPEVLPFVERGVVACAETPCDFARAIQEAYRFADSQRCRVVASANSWRSRFSMRLGQTH